MRLDVDPGSIVAIGVTFLLELSTSLHAHVGRVGISGQHDLFPVVVPLLALEDEHALGTFEQPLHLLIALSSALSNGYYHTVHITPRADSFGMKHATILEALFI